MLRYPSTLQAAWLMTQSTARSAAIDGGGTDPVWSEGSKGSELRMAFDTLRTGDRVFLCLSVFDEDVGKDDTIGFGCVDVTDVAHREAGMPGSRVSACVSLQFFMSCPSFLSLCFVLPSQILVSRCFLRLSTTFRH